MNKLFLSLVALICCFSTLLGQDFSFAILSDTHISTNNDSAAEDLISVVSDINKNKTIDFVIVAGDITEVGDYKSLKLAKSILDKLEKKVYVVPGNHDSKWSPSAMNDFSNIFGYERFKFKHNGILFLGFNSGPIIRMSDGHINPQDIKWLQKELTNESETPTFLVTHYPLKDGDVDNWHEVTDVVRQFNIISFIGGHYHNNQVLSYDGIPGLICRSTLKDAEQNTGYTLINVHNNSIDVFEKKASNNSTQWHSLDFTTKPYDVKGNLNKRPNFNINTTYTQVKQKWINLSKKAIYGSPATYKNKLYVGDEAGTFTAYKIKDGSKVWSQKVGGKIIGTPAVEDGIAVFGAADNYIYGFEANKGELIWKIKADAPVLGAVTIENKIAYIGDSQGTFRAIDIRTGRVKWIYNQVKHFIEAKPLISDDKVIFGAWDNTLYALNKEAGYEEWTWKTKTNTMHYSPAAVWPVSANGMVFITDPTRTMTAIDINNGETVWSTKQSVVRETIGLSKDNLRLYSKTMNDSLVCYSATTLEPQQIWSTDIGFGYEHAPSMQVEEDGVVYGSTKNGLIFAVNAFTGQLLWKHKVGNTLVNTVVPLAKRKIIFTTTSGAIGLLEWKI